jgi:hypothetical protein
LEFTKKEIEEMKNQFHHIIDFSLSEDIKQWHSTFDLTDELIDVDAINEGITRLMNRRLKLYNFINSLINQELSKYEDEPDEI